jgi:hypothetical protein
VTRLSFHKSLYAGTAVDEAVKVFAAHARFELTETPDAWVVQVSHDDAARERRVGLELSNYALGLTVQSRQEAA